MATGWGRQAWGPDITIISGGGGSSDLNPPIVTNIVPATGITRGSTQSVQFDVIDDVQLRVIILFADFHNGGPCEVIWDGLGFRAPYGASVESTLIAGRSMRFLVSRAGGWPSNILEIVVNAVDASGNET